jgi:hypothetical protein
VHGIPAFSPDLQVIMLASQRGRVDCGRQTSDGDGAADAVGDAPGDNDTVVSSGPAAGVEGATTAGPLGMESTHAPTMSRNANDTRETRHAPIVEIVMELLRLSAENDPSRALRHARWS